MLASQELCRTGRNLIEVRPAQTTQREGGASSAPPPLAGLEVPPPPTTRFHAADTWRASQNSCGHIGASVVDVTFSESTEDDPVVGVSFVEAAADIG